MSWIMCCRLHVKLKTWNKTFLRHFLRRILSPVHNNTEISGVFRRGGVAAGRGRTWCQTPLWKSHVFVDSTSTTPSVPITKSSLDIFVSVFYHPEIYVFFLGFLFVFVFLSLSFLRKTLSSHPLGQACRGSPAFFLHWLLQTFSRAFTCMGAGPRNSWRKSGGSHLDICVLTCRPSGKCQETIRSSVHVWERL